MFGIINNDNKIIKGRRTMKYEKQFRRIVEDLSIRQENLAKYMPFFELYTLNKRSLLYTHLDMGFLILGILAHLLYEGHLKDKGLTFDEIEVFLQKLISESYQITYEGQELADLTRYILDKLQNGGSPFSYYYYHQGLSKVQETKLRYISYTRDGKLEKNFYRITSTGIDFLLQTKEFGEESKISIQLILLRKLVDSEDFGSALNTLENINIEIKKEAKRKGEILEELSYGFTESYENYTQNVRKRLEDEQSLFKETLSYLNSLEFEYLYQIEPGQMTAKEQRFKTFIIDMKMALTETVELHSLLLDTVVDLRQRAEEMLMMRRKTIFKENFSFQHYLEGALCKNDVRGLKMAMDSLFNIRLPKQFAPTRIDHLLLLKDVINEEKEILDETNQETMYIETLDAQIEERLCFNYELMFRELLLLVKEKGQISLSDYLAALKLRYGTKVCENYDLSSFLLTLTQNKGGNHGEKVFDFKLLSRGEFKVPDAEWFYHKIISETESLACFKESTFNVEVKRGEYIEEGPLEITNCNYYIKR